MKINIKMEEVITENKYRHRKTDENVVTAVTEQRKLNPNVAFGESPEATLFIPQNLQKAWGISGSREKWQTKIGLFKILQIPNLPSPKMTKAYSLERAK